jgi:hypothetical protein
MSAKKEFAKNAPIVNCPYPAPVIQVRQLAGTASAPGEKPGKIAAPVREFFAGP